MTIIIDPVAPEKAITTDVEDSFSIFYVSGMFYVKAVYPHGGVGTTVAECETREAAELVRDELINHVGSWAEIVWKEFAAT